MAQLSFYNPYTRKKEKTSSWWLERDANGKPRAVAQGDGGQLYRYVSESFYRNNGGA